MWTQWLSNERRLRATKWFKGSNHRHSIISRLNLSPLGRAEKNISVQSAHWLMPSALWQTHDCCLNRFDTRYMIGWSARAVTDSKFFLPVVKNGFICICYERPGPGRSTAPWLGRCTEPSKEKFWGKTGLAEILGSKSPLRQQR